MIIDRIDAITKIPEAYRHTHLPAPKSVKIEISPRCNYRCGFCALRTREKQPTVDMDFDLFQNITTQMREAGVEEIGCFYLGESMMNPRLLVDAIRWCKQELEFPYVFLTSNASLATPDVVAMIMQADLDSLKWSVNAADENQFKDVMAVSPRLYEDAIRNIKEAHAIRKRYGFQTGLYASSIQYDGEQQERMQALIDRHILPYVDQHYWLPLYGMSMSAKAIEERIGYRPSHGNIGRVGALRQPLPCWSAFTEGHVRVDGHLSACCFGSDDKFDVGDLTQGSFMSQWNSPAFQAIRQAHLDTLEKGPCALKGTMCEVCSGYE